MIDIANEALIRSTLGDSAEFTTITGADGSWPGLSIVRTGPITGADRLFIEHRRTQARTLVQENWRRFHERDIRLWTRSGLDIHAFPGLPVLNIARYESVGCVPYLNQDNRRRILAVIQEIYAIQPFAILFAAESDMEAVFLDKITFEQAVHFQDLIMEVSPEVFNDASCELCDDQIYDEYAMAKVITEKQAFWLRWS
jgi:hypothetical protein